MEQCHSVPPSVVIIDDNSTFLRAAAEMLARNGVEVLATMESHDDLHRVLSARRPSWLLVDVNLADADGFEVGAAAAAAFPGLDVVMMSSRPKAMYAARLATSPWVCGYILKDHLSAAVLQGLR
jgi:DNA-binding NtrC family response regulator